MAAVLVFVLLATALPGALAVSSRIRGGLPLDRQSPYPLGGWNYHSAVQGGHMSKIDNGWPSDDFRAPPVQPGSRASQSIQYGNGQLTTPPVPPADPPEPPQFEPEDFRTINYRDYSKPQGVEDPAVNVQRPKIFYVFPMVSSVQPGTRVYIVGKKLGRGDRADGEFSSVLVNNVHCHDIRKEDLFAALAMKPIVEMQAAFWQNGVYDSATMAIKGISAVGDVVSGLFGGGSSGSGGGGGPLGSVTSLFGGGDDKEGQEESGGEGGEGGESTKSVLEELYEMRAEDAELEESAKDIGRPGETLGDPKDIEEMMMESEGSESEAADSCCHWSTVVGEAGEEAGEEAGAESEAVSEAEPDAVDPALLSDLPMLLQTASRHRLRGGGGGEDDPSAMLDAIAEKQEEEAKDVEEGLDYLAQLGTPSVSFARQQLANGHQLPLQEEIAALGRERARMHAGQASPQLLEEERERTAKFRKQLAAFEEGDIKPGEEEDEDEEQDEDEHKDGEDSGPAGGAFASLLGGLKDKAMDLAGSSVFDAAGVALEILDGHVPDEFNAISCVLDGISPDKRRPQPWWTMAQGTFETSFIGPIVLTSRSYGAYQLPKEFDFTFKYINGNKIEEWLESKLG